MRHQQSCKSRHIIVITQQTPRPVVSNNSLDNVMQCEVHIHNKPTSYIPASYMYSVPVPVSAGACVVAFGSRDAADARGCHRLTFILNNLLHGWLIVVGL